MKLDVFEVCAEEPCFIGRLSVDETLGGLYETREYWIRCYDERSKLFVDDSPVPRDASGRYWCWSPGYFAGEVLIELEQPGRASALLYIADIGPAPHKTGRAQYVDYLAQIVAYAPSMVLGTEPAQQGLGGRSGTVLSLWLRYARLRRFIEPYLAGLQRIVDRPIIRTRSRREQLALPMVKRVDSTTLRQIAQNPTVLATLATGHSSVASPREQRLDVPFHEPTFDNPANRLMARQLRDVSRLVKRLLAALCDYREQGSETVTEVAPRLPRRIKYLRRLDKQLRRIARQAPFCDADTRQSSATELNAAAGNPHYSMTHRLGVRLLRQGVSALADDEQHYLAPTWEIYEAWCFVTLAQQLEARYPAYNWDLHHNPKSADRMLRGRHGDRTVTLYSQLVCPSLEQANAYGYCSITRERRPDLVLEVVDPDGKRFICLDSKYSVSRARILDAMASAHIYRDSLRLEGRPPIKSMILVPMSSEVSQLADESYQNRHNVGCIALSANGEAKGLLARLLE